MAVDLDTQWVGRLQAAGRAQGRYLWILLIACIFYPALYIRYTEPSPEAPPPLEVPFVGVQLDASVVFSTGPLVISFIVLIVMGALRAYSHALDQLNLTKVVGAAEPLDVHPNAIDFAVYTTQKTPIWLATIVYFAYPVFLAGALVEAAWLFAQLWTVRDSVPGKYWMFACAAIIWFAASWQVGGSTIRRIRKASNREHLRGTPRAGSDA